MIGYNLCKLTKAERSVNMRLEFYGKNIDLTDALKDQAERKLSKLDKYFSEETEARVVFKTKKGQHTAEVTVFIPGSMIRAEETSEDMYASIDKAVDVLSRQIRKYKTRLKNNRQNHESIRYENFEQEMPEHNDTNAGARIVREKDLELRPMSDEEATLQMELLNHNFFIYLNSDTDLISLIYKRRDGNYGKINVN